MFRSLSLLAVGALVGGLVVWQLPARGQVPSPLPPQAENQPVDLTVLAADVARLKTVTPTLSHVMADAAFQYSNLWFSGQEQNWPLAAFYFNETRGRIRWFLRLNPTAKTPDGEVVDMASIFEAVDTSSLAAVKAAIDQKDRAAFGTAYKVMLESCYSCHKSVGRPYLRPMIPTAQPQTIINYSPSATWP
jgi:hypothetical protein